MTPTCKDFVMKLVKLVHDRQCGPAFTVYQGEFYVTSEESRTVLRSDEASITPLLNGLKPRQMLDVLDELVELGMLSKRQSNRYAITSKMFEAIP